MYLPNFDHRVRVAIANSINAVQVAKSTQARWGTYYAALYLKACGETLEQALEILLKKS